MWRVVGSGSRWLLINDAMWRQGRSGETPIRGTGNPPSVITTEICNAMYAAMVAYKPRGDYTCIRA